MKILTLITVLTASAAWAFTPGPDQCTVRVQWPDASRERLVIQGETYRCILDCKNVGLEFSTGNAQPAIQIKPGILLLDETPVTGPGRVNIYNFGTQMYEVHLRDLKAEGFKGDVELALYCYANRVFVNLNVQSYDDKPVPKPRFAGITTDGTQTVTVLLGDDAAQYAATARRDRATSAMYAIADTYSQDGTAKSTAVACIGSDSTEALLHLLEQEDRAKEVTFKLDGGVFDGYQPAKGFYQVTTTFTGPRSFEEAWINPNQRYEVDMDVSAPFPAQVICNVRNSYGVLEAAVMTDEWGFPLPVQVQVCKNFAGENEEGKQEGDTPYGDSYVPLSIAPEKPFEGRVYHLFGNWGTHPLKQISSIRFFHHYFHASLGPTETFCYVPFEFPRPDHRNYIWADVRGLSNFYWPGQPQHDHVSVLGTLRYQSSGTWVNNLLQDTRIYLTSPNMASFALDYLSEDGKVATTLEIFELPQQDEARSFVHMTTKVLAPVDLDDDSTHALRFLNAGAYIVHTIWPKVAYTAASGETTVVDVPADDTWRLEGVPLGKDTPFAAAYPNKNGNMCFLVNSFEGVLGGQPADQFGLSVFGGKEWTEMFLTAPRPIRRLEKGDHITADYFVMPYGHADVDYKPAERQRTLYGARIAKVTAQYGEVVPGFPSRVKVGLLGYARFTLTDGSDWTPILVEGFPSNKAPMLWENRGSWLFHDQQVNGNDWYQSYRAEDGSVGFVFVVKVRPEQTHDYLVTLAPNAHAITQRNGFVTIEGGPMDFISPVPFADLECTEVPDTGLYHCVGNAERATATR